MWPWSRGKMVGRWAKVAAVEVKEVIRFWICLSLSLSIYLPTYLQLYCDIAYHIIHPLKVYIFKKDAKVFELGHQKHGLANN